jgi:antitoxin component YwqK of YwqJK toxin-antitoxin module
MINDSTQKMVEFIAEHIDTFIDMGLEIPDGYYSSSVRRFTIVNGRLQGEYKSWCSNGKLSVHCFYKDGELEGEFKNWNSDGIIFIHCFYKDGEVVKRLV